MPHNTGLLLLDGSEFPSVRIDNVKRRMRILTALAAIGGFLFGYDTGEYNMLIPSCLILWNNINTVFYAWQVFFIFMLKFSCS